MATENLCKISGPHNGDFTTEKSTSWIRGMFIHKSQGEDE